MTARFWLGALGALAGCAPELEDRPYLIERQRVIAVLIEPPELRPRAALRVTPIVASRRRGASEPSYHFCPAPPPPADPRPASEACLEDTSLPLTLDGEGALGELPAEACARFGPDPVGSEFRPRDPDDSGGFYQPLVVDGFGERSVAQVRIVCPLPDVPIELARAYSEAYVVNRNPEGLRIEREANGQWQPLSAVRRGEQVQLRVAWDASARERYVWLAASGAKLEERRESFSVAWFVTDGALRAALTSVGEADPHSDSPNTFEAPERTGTLGLWAVVHDSRGGSAVVRRALTVED